MGLFVHYSRWSLGSIWILNLFPSLCTFRRHIVFHLLVIADLVGFGQFLKLALLLWGHGLKNMTMIRFCQAQCVAFLSSRPTFASVTWVTDASCNSAPPPPNNNNHPPEKHCSPSVQLTFHLSEHFLENSEKFTEVPGFFFLCSSRQVCTKYA